MELPDTFELRPVIRDGVQVGTSLPSREDQVRAFNELVMYLRDRDAGKKPAPSSRVEEEITEVNGWPVGTSHSISNQGKAGYSVSIRDERFRTLAEARMFAELMRELLCEPREASQETDKK